MPVTRALLLDVDDTLIDTRAAMVAAGAAAVAALWPEAGAEVHHDAGVHFHRDPGGFFTRFATGELGFAQMREARVAELLETFSLTATDEVNRRFEEAYEPAFFTNARLFDDVLPLVEAASTAGIPMGLLTNSASYYTQQKLEITGLERVFAVVVTRDTLGFGKPDPRAFHHACALLGAQPRDTTYVGDEIEIDAVAAKDAGLNTVWLQRDAGDGAGACVAHAHGIPVVASLKDVVALLRGD
ncbi:MAG TPA: HAD family hydrolase [Dermatophilaceae bacterium]